MRYPAHHSFPITHSEHRLLFQQKGPDAMGKREAIGKEEREPALSLAEKDAEKERGLRGLLTTGEENNESMNNDAVDKEAEGREQRTTDELGKRRKAALKTDQKIAAARTPAPAEEAERGAPTNEELHQQAVKLVGRLKRAGRRARRTDKAKEQRARELVGMVYNADQDIRRPKRPKRSTLTPKEARVNLENAIRKAEDFFGELDRAEAGEPVPEGAPAGEAPAAEPKEPARFPAGEPVARPAAPKGGVPSAGEEKGAMVELVGATELPEKMKSVLEGVTGALKKKRLAAAMDAVKDLTLMEQMQFAGVILKIGKIEAAGEAIMKDPTELFTREGWDNVLRAFKENKLTVDEIKLLVKVTGNVIGEIPKKIRAEPKKPEKPVEYKKGELIEKVEDEPKKMTEFPSKGEEDEETPPMPHIELPQEDQEDREMTPEEVDRFGLEGMKGRKLLDWFRENLNDRLSPQLKLEWQSWREGQEHLFTQHWKQGNIQGMHEVNEALATNKRNLELNFLNKSFVVSINSDANAMNGQAREIADGLSKSIRGKRLENIVASLQSGNVEDVIGQMDSTRSLIGTEIPRQTYTDVRYFIELRDLSKWLKEQWKRADQLPDTASQIAMKQTIEDVYLKRRREITSRAHQAAARDLATFEMVDGIYGVLEAGAVGLDEAAGFTTGLVGGPLGGVAYELFSNATKLIVKGASERGISEEDIYESASDVFMEALPVGDVLKYFLNKRVAKGVIERIGIKNIRANIIRSLSESGALKKFASGCSELCEKLFERKLTAIQVMQGLVKLTDELTAKLFTSGAIKRGLTSLAQRVTTEEGLPVEGSAGALAAGVQRARSTLEGDT